MVTIVGLKFAMSSHFPLPKNFALFVPTLSNVARRATSDQKPRQMINSRPVLFCSSNWKSESNQFQKLLEIGKGLCVRWLGVINLTWENLQIAKHKSVRWTERTHLCFAICRFSQVRFITPSHLTHNLFFYFQQFLVLISSLSQTSLENCRALVVEFEVIPPWPTSGVELDVHLGDGILPTGPLTKKLQQFTTGRAEMCVRKISCVDACWRASEADKARGRNELDNIFIISVPDVASQEWLLNKGSVERSRHERHFCSLLPYF